MVVRTGKLFELGEYPDKQFALNEAEADAAIAAFRPVPLNLEHQPTILDRLLGHVKRIWREGTAIEGEYEVPDWLHSETASAPLKLSAEWDRQSKRLVGAALVLEPRVRDAAIMCAFSVAMSAGTRPAKRADGHDSAPKGYPEDRDEYADPENYLYPVDNAEHARAAWGYIHKESDRKRYTDAELRFVEARIARACRRFGIDTDDAGAKADGDKRRDGVKDGDGIKDGNGRSTTMSLYEKLAAMFTRAAQEEGAAGGGEPATPAAPTAGPVSGAPAPAVAGFAAEVDALKGEIARLRQTAMAAEANAWADAEIRAGRMLPHERASRVALYARAAEDDAVNPVTVTFGEGAGGTRLQALVAEQAARPSHGLLVEGVPSVDNGMELFKLLNRTGAPGTEAAPTEERKNQLKAMTALGTADIAARRNGK